jgi:Tfp pilus assembly protein PilF
MRRNAWLAAVVLVTAVIVVFLPVLDNGFVDWDDETAIVTNPGIQGLTTAHLRWMFTSFTLGHYHPLTWLSMAFDYTLWGLDPAGFHLTNLLLHALNAVLVFRLVLALLERTIGSRGGVALVWWSAAGAVVWAVHPVRVEAVAWATERRELLCATLLLGTVLAYLRAADEEAESPAYRHWLAGSLSLFLLSLLSKAWGITLPAVLLVLDLLVLGRRDRSPQVSVARLLREKAPYVLIGLPFAVLGSLASRTAGALLTWQEHGPLQRTMQAAWGLCFYLRTTLWPLHLSPIYDLERPLDVWQLRHVASLVAVVGVTIALWGLRRRWPSGLAAWICYAILVSPTLGFAQSGPQKAADRYTYLCTIPWTVLLAAGCWRAWDRTASRVPSPRLVRGALAAGILLAAVGLGTLARAQTRHWRNATTLWDYAVRVAPGSATARNGLGYVYMQQGHTAEAIDQFRAALARREIHGGAHYNLGILLYERGELSEALEHFTRAIEINSRIAKGHNGRGLVRLRLGDLPGALTDLDRAIEEDPSFAVAYGNRGLVRMAMNDPAPALADFERALRLDPALTEAERQRTLALLALQGQR